MKMYDIKINVYLLNIRTHIYILENKIITSEEKLQKSDF